ncbi:MAG: PAS domain S-box protein [Ignavibacteriae bacterium]|nr:PAS domain S-box protein [Ignavibacteriota bacterium]
MLDYSTKNKDDLISEIELLKEDNRQLKYYNDETKEILKLKIAALDTSTNSILITDPLGDIIWVNRSFTKLTGYHLEEIIGKNPSILQSGKTSSSIYINLWETINSGKEWEGSFVNKNKDGALYEENIKITPIFNSQKTILYFIATKYDITEINKNEEALNDTYIKYEELSYIYNQSPAIGFLWATDKNKTVEFITDNVKQFGYTPSEFYSNDLNLFDIIFEDDKKKVKKEISKAIVKGKERLKQHYRIVNKSGEIRWVDSHLFARLSENEVVTHLQGVILDVTDKKRAEEESKSQIEQLMQADKMIALGTLVSGIAHEINNPNNFVMLNTPLIEKVWFSILPILESHYEENGDFSVGNKLKYSKIKDSMPLLLGGIFDGSQRIKNIVTDLKSFARKDVSGYQQQVNLNEVIQTSVNLTANLVAKSTNQFSVKYCNCSPVIKGNKQKLEQVVINLIENSCQALTDRKQKVQIEVTKENGFSYIKIADEGSGMTAATIRKITNPFFTTKRNSGGTGLGLSISSKIIDLHKGELKFISKPDKGTKATIKLRIYQDESE